MNFHYTYIYADPDTHQPFYVGKGSKRSAWRHLTEEHHETKNFHKWAKIQSILKIGKEPIIQLLKFQLESEAYKIEEFLTQHHGIESEGGILTNMIHGGKGGWAKPKSDDHKRKIGEANKLANKNTETTERKRKSALGNTSGKANKGIIKTQEWIDKINETKKKNWETDPTSHPRYGTKHTEESKEKNRQKHLGKKLSTETKKKIGDKHKGLKWSQETKDAIALGNSDTWSVTFPDGHNETIRNLRAFAKIHNFSTSNITTHGHTKGFSAVKIPTV